MPEHLGRGVVHAGFQNDDAVNLGGLSSGAHQQAQYVGAPASFATSGAHAHTLDPHGRHRAK